MDQVGNVGEPTSAAIPTVLIGSQLAAQNKRKEKARVAARARRSQEASIIMEMANELQITQERMRRTDKATIVKLAIDYIKAFEILCRFRSNYDSAIDGGGRLGSDIGATICEKYVGRVKLLGGCDSGISSETSGSSEGDDTSINDCIELSGDSSATCITCNNGTICPDSISSSSSSRDSEKSACLQIGEPLAYRAQLDSHNDQPLSCTIPILPPATSNKRLHSVSNQYRQQYQNHQQRQNQQQEQSKPGHSQPQSRHQQSAVPIDKHPAPKLSTRSIFTPKTDDMDLHFLLIDEREDGRSQFVLKPDTEIEDEDDLTHLAPQSGDISILLEVEPLDGIILDTSLFSSGSPPIKKLMSKDLMDSCCVGSIGAVN